MIQIAFIIVLFCHIPFIFFAGKEGLCIIIDEILRKSISNVLWHKLQSNTEFHKESILEEPPNPDLLLPFEEAELEGTDRASLVERKSAKLRATETLSEIPA